MKDTAPAVRLAVADLKAGAKAAPQEWDELPASADHKTFVEATAAWNARIKELANAPAAEEPAAEELVEEPAAEEAPAEEIVVEEGTPVAEEADFAE